MSPPQGPPPPVIVTRFAPSPTGLLHLGHAHAALFAEHAALSAGGRFLLRIEDLDGTRCRKEFVAAIFRDLAWLGLRWEEPVRRQSEHFAFYRAALDSLAASGLLYPCFCTRRQILAEVARSPSAPQGDAEPIYPGTCRTLDPARAKARIAAGEAYALRLDMSRACRLAGPLSWHDRARGRMEARPGIFGDVVLARKETPASYHLAVVLDDAAAGVTLVTRGEDLLAATHVHRLLQFLLDLPVPDYHHHRLIADAAGRRLAKRDGAPSLADLRAQGLDPAEVRRLAGFPQSNSRKSGSALKPFP